MHFHARPIVRGSRRIACRQDSLAILNRSTAAVIERLEGRRLLSETPIDPSLDTPLDPPADQAPPENLPVQAALADVSIQKISNPSSVHDGDDFQYEIQVQSHLSTDAQNVVVTDTLPSQTLFESLDAPAGWTNTTPTVGTSGTLTFTKDSAFTEAEGQEKFTIHVHVPTGTPGQTINNTAVISTTTPEQSTNDDSATAPTLIINDTPPPPTGSISGEKFNDLNGNGTKDTGDIGVQGVTINLDKDANGTIDATTTTDANGNYSFSNLASGTYVVTESVPTGWMQTTSNPSNIIITNAETVTEVNFGDFKLVAISGEKFNDVNGNGVKDAGDNGIAGVTIDLDKGADGSVDQTTTTDANGNYGFTGVGPGTYRIREETPTGTVQTTTDPTDIVTSSGTDLSGVDFGNFKLVSLSGTKFDDTNGDGTRETEPGLIGFTFDLFKNGGTNPIDIALSDSTGNYTFGTLVGPGTYSVREVVPAGWVQTTANPPDITTTSGTNSTFADTGDFKKVSISGVKFNDINGDGTQETGDNGLQNITINLFSNNVLLGTTMTDAQGNYSFSNLGPGKYHLTETIPVGSTQTASPADITVSSGTNVTNANFGDQLTVVQQPPPKICIGDVCKYEGDCGYTAFCFTVTRSGDTSKTSTVNYKTADCTAQACSDYVATCGTLCFKAGETCKTITVLVKGDTCVEADETFKVLLCNPTNATIGNGIGTGTIKNDDQPPCHVNIYDQCVKRMSCCGLYAMVFTVKLDAACSRDVCVNYNTADGNARCGSDYNGCAGAITFKAGETCKTITIWCKGSPKKQPSSNYFVCLTGATNAWIGCGKAKGTIS
jgi:hypothetical protein